MKKWEVVFKHDVRYSGFTLEVEIDQSSGYYDEVIVDAELTISVEK